MSITVLAIDGHDGAGKTTLGRGLAERLGAAYVRPFSGPDGPRMLEAAERGDHGRAAALARAMVERALAPHAGLVVCDRHWMTAFTLLPEPYWDAWQPLPPTALCWAGLDATRARLAERGEPPHPDAYHAGYLGRYRALAERFGALVLPTDELSEAECAARLHAWAAARVAAR